MNKKVYEIEVELIIKTIDIAIESFTNIPPKDFKERDVKQIIDVYLDYKNKTINPMPEFKNTRSLRYIKNDILIYFQETNNSTVEYFWEKIYSNKLAIERINQLEKIIKKGKIRNHLEYDIVIDLLPPLLESKTINDEVIKIINNMIFAFEKKKLLILKLVLVIIQIC